MFSGGLLVASPAAGLGSNSNYFLDSNFNSLTNLSVPIDMAQDIVCGSVVIGAI